MACTLGIEQDCGECRMCGNGKGGKEMFVVNGDMFGRYVNIPHVLAEDGEKFIFKVVGRLQSNAYCNVPIGGINNKIEIHKEIVDVLHVIQCGVDETEVLTVALKDCEFVEPRTNAEKIKGMGIEELAEVFEDKVSSFDCDVCSSKYAGMDICEERNCHKFAVKWLKKWLESECDSECLDQR